MDENVFRVPPLPVRTKRSPKATKPPLQEQNQENSKNEGDLRMSFSPGTCATTTKKEEMIKRLEKRRSQRKSMIVSTKPAVNPKLDLSLSEQALMTQPVSDILQNPPQTPTSKKAFDGESSFLVVNQTPRRGPVFSTPYSSRRRTTVEDPEESSNIGTSVESPSRVHESHEDRQQRQMDAFAIWSNSILRTSTTLCEGEVDLGATTKDATKKLQDFLTKKIVGSPGKKSDIVDILNRPAMRNIKERAKKLFNDNDIPFQIKKLVDQKLISIRSDCHVFTDLGLKTSLLRVFFSFHPIWLHMGLEIVLGSEIQLNQGSSFCHVVAKTIDSLIFSDPILMKNKKFVIGTVRKILTPEGEAALNRHFLRVICQFLFCQEFLKTSDIIDSDPRLFTRKSPFKSLEEICSELSRLVIAASSLPIMKLFLKVGFKPSYKQGFFDDFDYVVRSFADMTDGVIFGKLVEIICSCGKGEVMKKLRNPGGDRLRKIGNMTAVLEEARLAGYDIGAVKPDQIVGCNKDVILELFWRLVGVYVIACDSENRKPKGTGSSIDSSVGVDGAVLEHCRLLRNEIGVDVSCLDSLKDGKFLAAMWARYNQCSNHIETYPGRTLMDKVAAAAESEFEIPKGLKDAIPLFAHLYMKKLEEMKRAHDAASDIAINPNLRGFSGNYRFEGRISDISSILSTAEDATFIVNAPSGSAPAIGDAADLSALPSEPTLTEFENVFHPSSSQQDANADERLGGGRAPLGVESTDVLQSLDEAHPVSSFTSPAQLESYAIKIQAIIRGFLTRRQVHRMILDRLRLKAQNFIIGQLNREIFTDVQQFVHEIVETVAFEEEERRRQLAELTIVRIQALARGLLSRKLVNRYREHVDIQKLIQDAETKIQKSIRRFQEIKCSRNEKAKRDEELRRDAAAIKIQCFVRRYQAQSQLQRLKDQREEISRRQLQGITVVQAHARKFLARKRLEALKKERLLREGLISKFQAICKGAIVRKSYHQLCAERNSAALKIQTAVRKWNARRKAKLQDELVQRSRLNAIIIVQCCARRFLSRRKLEALKEEKQRFVSNIVTVQSLIRRFLAKQKFLVLKRDKNSRLAAESTIISLQPLARGALGRRKFADFRANVNKRRNEAAIIIQCLVRKYQARCRLQTLKANYAEAQRCQMQTIINLQAYARRWLALKRFYILQEQKKRLVESVIKLQACSRRYLAIKKLAALKEKSKEQQQNLEQPFQCSDGNCEEPIAQCNLTSRPGSLHDLLNLEVDEVDMEGLPPLKKNRFLEIDPVSKQYLGAIGVRIINDFMEKEIEKIRHRRETAAIKIQSWYRGVSKRNAMSSIIESRKNNMEAYMNEAALQERVEEDVEEQNYMNLPARQRLLMSCERIYDMSLYRCKVAAIIIDRITSLSPCLCRFFVEECHGFDVLLDRLESCNRSSGNCEIVAIISRILGRLVEINDPLTRNEIKSHDADLSKCAVHLITAYHNLYDTVLGGVTILNALHQLSPEALPMSSAAYILKSTTARFSKLPKEDKRHDALRTLERILAPVPKNLELNQNNA